VCLISFAKAYVFDRLLTVLILSVPLTLSFHTFAVQYLSPRVLARCRWNDPKRPPQGLKTFHVLTCQFGSDPLKLLDRLF